MFKVVDIGRESPFRQWCGQAISAGRFDPSTALSHVACHSKIERGHLDKIEMASKTIIRVRP
jgi:hypothetical protein